MFHTILKKIQEVLLSEAVEGGRLPTLKDVFLGDYRTHLIPSEKYPCAMLLFNGCKTSGDGRRRVEFELTYELSILAINSSLEEAAESLEALVWDETEGSGANTRGIIPVLLGNPALKIEEQLFRLEIDSWEVISGADDKERATSAIRIPIRVKMVKSLI